MKLDLAEQRLLTHSRGLQASVLAFAFKLISTIAAVCTNVIALVLSKPELDMQVHPTHHKHHHLQRKKKANEARVLGSGRRTVRCGKLKCLHS